MIKLVLLDVDGTLTDGGIYRGNNGEELKRFNVKDGYVIVNAQKLGVEFGIITGRKSELVEIRVILEEIMKKTGLRKEEIAYMGDDLNDVLIMKQVGLSGAPKDAVNEVIQIADFISEKNGGSGAVREFVEHILKKDGKWQTFLENVK